MKVEIGTASIRPCKVRDVSVGSLARIVTAYEHKERLGEVFIRGVFQIVFLSDGGIWHLDAAESVFQAQILDRGQQVTLTQE